MKIVSALKYYLVSIFTLVTGVNFYAIPQLIIKGKVILKTRVGINFWVKTMIEIWTIKEVVLDNEYEVYRKLSNDDIVIDIGAAIGEFTIYAAAKAKKVYAYEIASERVNRLKLNIMLNDIKNIEVINERADSLDKIFIDNNIDRCNFLKVDCEGCEYALFNNASPDILTRIDYLSMEVHFFDSSMRNNYKDMVALLSKYFEIAEIENKVHSNIAFVYAIRKMN